MDNLQQQVEALIFSAEQPISISELKQTLDAAFETEFSEQVITDAVEAVKNRFKADIFSFEIVELAGGYQFLSKPPYHHAIGTLLKLTTKKRLSQATLETLSIVAYKQPTTKTDVEQIRGVNSDYAIQKLLEKELIEIKGRAETPGRPLTYGTSEKFMHYFGIKNLNDLPKLKDFKEPDSQIGAEQNAH